VAVALPRLQYRVADSQSQRTHTILQTRTARNGYTISGFGLTRAPNQPQGVDRKNTVVGKCRGKAATATKNYIETARKIADNTIYSAYPQHHTNTYPSHLLKRYK